MSHKCSQRSLVEKELFHFKDSVRTDWTDLSPLEKTGSVPHPVCLRCLSSHCLCRCGWYGSHVLAWPVQQSWCSRGYGLLSAGMGMLEVIFPHVPVELRCSCSLPDSFCSTSPTQILFLCSGSAFSHFNQRWEEVPSYFPVLFAR